MDRETMARRLLVRAGAILAPDDPSRADLDAMPEGLREIVDAFADAALAECREAAKESHDEAWKTGACERLCACEACTTSPEAAWNKSNARKKWVKGEA